MDNNCWLLSFFSSTLTWTSEFSVSFVSVCLCLSANDLPCLRLHRAFIYRTVSSLHLAVIHVHRVELGSRPETVVFKQNERFEQELVWRVAPAAAALALLQRSPETIPPVSRRAELFNSAMSPLELETRTERRQVLSESSLWAEPRPGSGSVSSFGSFLIFVSSFGVTIVTQTSVCELPAAPPTPQPTDDVDIYFETPADDKEHSRFQRAKEQLEIRHRNRMERVGSGFDESSEGAEIDSSQTSCSFLPSAANPGSKGVGRGRSSGEEPAEGWETDPDPGKTLILSSRSPPVFVPLSEWDMSSQRLRVAPLIIIILLFTLWGGIRAPSNSWDVWMSLKGSELKLK